MPPTVNFQIGIHQFLNMVGQIPEPQERIERIVRPGVTYAGYRKAGKGGREPFQVQTTVDVLDHNAGHAKSIEYTALVGDVPQTFIYADYNYTIAQGAYVVVMAAELISIDNVLAWSGAFDDDNTARLITQWTLEFTDL